MAEDFWCEYKTNSSIIAQKEHQDKIKIIQLFVENGQIKIGDEVYPIIYGDLSS